MSLNLLKKTLSIYSFTSCGGCQFEFLGQYEKLSSLLQYYEIDQTKLDEENFKINKSDVSIIFGSLTQDQSSILKKIRANSNILIAIGACAHLGGIQSQRNILPEKLTTNKKNLPLNKIVKVDYVIPGCPIDQDELSDCLIDIYHDRVFNLPDLPVCFECRLNENNCLLKQNKPCLGPITRSGCKSNCPNNSEACLGCRGPLEQSNFAKAKSILGSKLDDEDLMIKMNYFGDYERDFNILNKKDN